MPGTIFVTGATGNQGGAVARHLLRQGFGVRALVRNLDAPAVRTLEEAGAQIVTGDLNEPASYKQHLKGIEGVFSVQTFLHGVDQEVAQGLTLARLVKDTDAGHLVYTSVSWADRETGISFFDSKRKIEGAIRELGIPHTILRPASLYENFLMPQVRNMVLKSGTLVTPVRKSAVQHILSAEDVGSFSAHIFNDPHRFKDMTITMEAEQLDGDGIAAAFSDVLRKKVKYSQLPGIIVRLAMGKDLHRMFRFVNETKDHPVANIPPGFPEMIGLRQWAEARFFNA